MIVIGSLSRTSYLLTQKFTVMVPLWKNVTLQFLYFWVGVLRCRVRVICRAEFDIDEILHKHEVMVVFDSFWARSRISLQGRT